MARSRWCFWIAGAALVAVNLTLLAEAGPNPLLSAGSQTTPPTDPIDLFAKLYPVFTHPRCINCHGVVQSFPGMIRSVNATHHDDPQGDSEHAADCGGCHDTPKILEKAWQFTAPDHMSWVGKSLEQLCAMQSAEVRIFNDAAGGSSRARSGSYLNHVETDPLITQAFDGRAGGARDPKPPEKPPLSRDDFLKAAQDWVNAGAGCGRVTGTIEQVESFEANYGFPAPGGGATTVHQTAKRSVLILRHADATATAQVEMSGHEIFTTTRHLTGATGACTVTTISTKDWKGVTPPLIEVRLDTKIAADFSYTIHAALQKDEATQQIDETKVIHDCGSTIDPSSPPATTDTPDWPMWTIRIACPAPDTLCTPGDPSKVPVLWGRMKKTIINANDAVDPQSWLEESPVGNNRADTGASLPITVRTVWNLDLGNPPAR